MFLSCFFVFSCFSSSLFSPVSVIPFHGFWWFSWIPRTFEIDPDPSKVVVLLRREHDSQKIMFFYQQIEFQKKHGFSSFLTPQKSSTNALFGVPRLDVFRFFLKLGQWKWSIGLRAPFWTTFGSFLDNCWILFDPFLDFCASHPSPHPSFLQLLSTRPGGLREAIK